MICEHCGAQHNKVRFCDRKCSGRYVASLKRKSVRDRIFPRIPILGPDECWPYQGQHKPAGYGVIYFSRKGHAVKRTQLYVHRAIWAELNGPIPDGLEVCHTCDNPPCCNPMHLFLGTHLQNMQDREAKGRGKYGPMREVFV